jgi:hypothetical protein
MPITIGHSGSPGLKAVSFAQVTASGSVAALAVPSGIVPKRAWITLELIGAQTIQAFRMIQNATETPTVAYTIEV